MPLRNNQMQKEPGSANWIFDSELDIHIPACRLCSGGPLEGMEIVVGYCDRCYPINALTPNHPRPPYGSVVRDRYRTMWLHSDESLGWIMQADLAHGDVESWHKVAGNNGPVYLVRWGWDHDVVVG